MATVYYVIYPSASGTPTAAQVKAGWPGTAVASGSETSPTTTGAFTFGTDAAGLAPSTSYKIALVWSGGATDSNVAESAAFTTYGSALCLQSGELVSRPFGPGDAKIYLTTAGGLQAKTTAGGGDRLVSLSGSTLLAN